MKHRPSWLGKKIRYFFQYRLTPVGQMAVFLMFLSASGIITVEIPIYQMFCGIVALFGVVEFCGTLFRPRLKVTATFPEKVTVGDTALGLVSIQNIGYFPACDIMCGCFLLPEGLSHTNARAMIPSLARGQQATLPVEILGERRGEYPIPHMSIHSTFPLNFMRIGSANVPVNKLTVVPSFHRLEQLDIPISHRYQHGGMLLESRSGNAAEYVGNREYIPGEPTKRLDFRAWARVGKPVVREYQEEFCSRVAIVLDTHVEPRWPFPPRQALQELEAAISLTAAVADSLTHMGTTIELFAAGPDLFFFQTADAQFTSFESILEILASIEPTRHNPFDQLTPAISESLESTSVVICLFTDWDETREMLVNQIIRSGCALRVLLVRERPPTRPFPHDEYYTALSPADVLRGDVCLL
ncbi:DUF58 domain-containing protein [Planctomicrobium piriforme]|uniref:Uncharacterized conserved protein, DUF58 family, contains vWF domain n=1 Tax=Planctomicrobium piriforme TaxID=1576369 RepID=A0A1I3DHM0_9PLAN|nr:DUF58 domain-containing protein [Planctomicrobium piriforme]SFH86244.1 Uncharacterized conserved protein, DUF58 family, contains vWF domain [Planctomicrobium piriforme]